MNNLCTASYTIGAIETSYLCGYIISKTMAEKYLHALSKLESYEGDASVLAFIKINYNLSKYK